MVISYICLYKEADPESSNVVPNIQTSQLPLDKEQWFRQRARWLNHPHTRTLARRLRPGAFLTAAATATTSASAAGLRLMGREPLSRCGARLNWDKGTSHAGQPLWMDETHSPLSKKQTYGAT